MLVKVNTSLAGADFSYNFGAIVEQAEFSAKVGNGWKSLCDEIDTADSIETADEEPVDEVAVAPMIIETTVKPAPVETAVKRGRRR